MQNVRSGSNSAALVWSKLLTRRVKYISLVFFINVTGSCLTEISCLIVFFPSFLDGHAK